LIMEVNAQSDSCVQNSNLKREKLRLTFDMPNAIDNAVKSPILEKDQLHSLLSDKQFKSYIHARRCYVASIPLLSVAAGYITVGCLFLAIWHDFIGSPFLNTVSYISFGVAFTFLIPGVTLIVHSAKKLDSITKDYNNQHYSSNYQKNIQLNFGLTQNGIGLKLNF